MHWNRTHTWTQLATMVAFAGTSTIANAQALTKAQQTSIDSLRKASPSLAAVTPAPPASSIADVAKVLSVPARDSIDKFIQGLQRETMGGIAVAIIPSIADNKPFDVASAILRTWHVGKVTGTGKDTKEFGAVLMIVPKETAPDKTGRCWVAAGIGMDAVLGDSIGATICGNVIIPYLKKMDYPGGIRAGVNAIAEQYRKSGAVRKEEFDARSDFADINHRRN